MKISKNGIDLIKRYEGCKLTAYQDSVGVWTCGWGTTGKDIQEGVTFTPWQAEERLIDHLAGVEDCVNDAVEVDITQNQFDALCSFTYNLGCKSLRMSTLLKKLNAGDIKAASEEFPRWNKAGGKVLRGLTARRIDEQRLFLQVSA